MIASNCFRTPSSPTRRTRIIFGSHSKCSWGGAPNQNHYCCPQTPIRFWNNYTLSICGVLCKYGAMFELDDDRAAQMDAMFQQAVTRANLMEAAKRLQWSALTC